MTTVQTIGVIGAGTMGSGIAQVCALVDMIGRKTGRGFHTYG